MNLTDIMLFGGAVNGGSNSGGSEVIIVEFDDADITPDLVIDFIEDIKLLPVCEPIPYDALKNSIIIVHDGVQKQHMFLGFGDNAWFETGQGDSMVALDAGTGIVMVLVPNSDVLLFVFTEEASEFCTQMGLEVPAGTYLNAANFTSEIIIILGDCTKYP